MYVRTTQRRNADSSVVPYVQLATKTRVDGKPVAKILVNLGREDALDRDGLARLVASINRYLGVVDDTDTGALQVGGLSGLVNANPRDLAASRTSSRAIAACCGLGSRTATTQSEAACCAADAVNASPAAAGADLTRVFQASMDTAVSVINYPFPPEPHTPFTPFSVQSPTR